MAFKLAVGNVVDVALKLEVFGQVLPLTLVCDRDKATAAADELWVMDAAQAATFLRSVVTGWKDQRLVLDEAGAAADFSPQALDFLLAQDGAPQALAGAYWLAARAKVKN